MHVFATAAGRVGGQNLLVPGILFYILFSILALLRAERRSAIGAVAVATIGCFALYLFAPNEGLGGGETKVRFAWAVFILGRLAAAVAARQLFKTPLAICTAILLSCNLFVTWQALRLTSHAVDDYIAATDRIPRDAVFVQIRFPVTRTIDAYGLSLMGREPLFYLDAYSAFRRGSIDVSDFEGLNPIFPLALRPRIGEGQRLHLWSLEGAGNETADSLSFVMQNLAVRIDYVVLCQTQSPCKLPPPAFKR